MLASLNIDSTMQAQHGYGVDFSIFDNPKIIEDGISDRNTSFIYMAIWQWWQEVTGKAKDLPNKIHWV
jgi:hypothetical protein